jgi:2,5-diamino-6-(ribosylamino)-4(3H)-pyrimidinone 5'-phosphate reductase
MNCAAQDLTNPLCMATSRIHFPDEDVLKLKAYLPSFRSQDSDFEAPLSTPIASRRDGASRPFVTLTFATSLDSALSLAPGVKTILSGSQSKSMTHFLRSQHDAICIGHATATADDPGLNCRLDNAMGLEHQPRPVIIDPGLKWNFEESSKVLQLAREGLGRAPFIITNDVPLNENQKRLLEAHGGKYICLSRGILTSNEGETYHHFKWADILDCLAEEGLRSVMIEGGGRLINSILEPGNNELVDSVIVTIAPTWLGQGGVVVSPPRRTNSHGQPIPAVRMTRVSWHPFGEDIVLCGAIQR